jgi:hypothetical protein
LSGCRAIALVVLDQPVAPVVPQRMGQMHTRRARPGGHFGQLSCSGLGRSVMGLRTSLKSHSFVIATEARSGFAPLHKYGDDTWVEVVWHVRVLRTHRAPGSGEESASPRRRGSSAWRCRRGPSCGTVKTGSRDFARCATFISPTSSLAGGGRPPSRPPRAAAAVDEAVGPAKPALMRAGFGDGNGCEHQRRAGWSCRP